MLTILFFTIVATLFAGYRITHLHELQRVNESTQSVIRDVQSAINDSSTALKTFTALHHQASTSSQAFKGMYAQIVLRDEEAIKSIGRFKHNNNNFQLPITHVVSTVDEMQWAVGLDLGHYDTLRAALPRAIESNEVAAMVAPSTWSDKTDLVIVQPGYDFSPMWNVEENRASTFSGGYWASLKFADIMTGSYSDPANSQVGIAVEIAYANVPIYTDPQTETFVTQPLYDQEFPSERAVGIESLLSPVTHVRHIVFGGGTVVVKVIGHRVFPLANLIVGLLLTAFLVSLYLFCLAVAFNRRRSNLEKLQALQAVTRERAKAERTLNSISESVIALDDEFRITYLNDSAVSVLGLRSGGNVGTPIAEATKLYDIENTGALFDLTGALENLSNSERSELDVMLRGSLHSRAT